MTASPLAYLDRPRAVDCLGCGRTYLTTATLRERVCPDCGSMDWESTPRLTAHDNQAEARRRAWPETENGVSM